MEVRSDELIQRPGLTRLVWNEDALINRNNNRSGDTIVESTHVASTEPTAKNTTSNRGSTQRGEARASSVDRVVSHLGSIDHRKRSEDQFRASSGRRCSRLRHPALIETRNQGRGRVGMNRHSNRHTPQREVQVAFKILMTHKFLQFA